MTNRANGGLPVTAEPSLARRVSHPAVRVAIQVTVLAALIAVVVWGQVWYGNRHHFFDLGIYYDAMTWWNGGHPLYDFARPDATMGSLGFTYPVFGALVLRPMAWFSLKTVQDGFGAISVLALGVFLWWLIRPVADRHGWPRWFSLALAAVLTSGLETIRDTFTLGQINFVLFALIGLDLLVLQPRHSRFVGIGIGLATAIKLVPGIFIVYLLVCRRWRAAALASGTAAAATLLGFVIAPHDSWVYFTHQMLGSQGIGQIQYAYNQSIMGMLARLGDTSHPSLLLWLIFVIPVLAYGLWRASRAAAVGDEVAGLTLAGCVGALVSPLTWTHHIISFVPALVILVDTATPPAGATGPVRDGLRRRGAMMAFAIVIYLTVTFSVLSLWEFNLHEYGGIVGYLLGNWFMWLTLLILILLPVRRPAAVLGRRAGQVAVYTYGDSPSEPAEPESGSSPSSGAHLSASSGGV
jgi:alpha-1,2-mannosyltransferase